MDNSLQADKHLHGFAATHPLEKTRAGEAKLSRTLLNFWLDATLLLALVFVVWVSALLQVVFPAPTQAAGWRLWGLTYDQWHNAQCYGIALGALLVLEHLVLHWNWVCGVVAVKILRVQTRPDEGSQALYGVGFFIVLIAVGLATIMAALLAVQQPRP